VFDFLNNLLFRRFIGLVIEDAVWDHSVFSKKRAWLFEHEVIEACLSRRLTAIRTGKWQRNAKWYRRPSRTRSTDLSRWGFRFA
jgi:hypothetical protein